MTENSAKTQGRSTQTRTSHTPGPWELTVYLSGTHSVLMRQWPTGNPKWPYGNLAASIYLFAVEGAPANVCLDGERLANARLIAAAPDLYRALKYAEDVLHDSGRDFPRPGSKENDAIWQARRALRKAEGRDTGADHE